MRDWRELNSLHAVEGDMLSRDSILFELYSRPENRKSKDRIIGKSLGSCIFSSKASLFTLFFFTLLSAQRFSLVLAVFSIRLESSLFREEDQCVLLF